MRAPVVAYLELACLSYAEDDDEAPRRAAAAAQLLAEHPVIARTDPHVAAAASDVDSLARQLADDPEAVNRAGGPHDWPPLLYLCYARHDRSLDEAAVLATARLLLESGADPDARFHWQGLDPPFTALTGAFGGGERGQPPHPHAIALARVLLDAGADPNDGQTLYNRQFTPDDSHLELLFAYGLGRGEAGAALLRDQLRWAITHGMTDRARLLAAHGVDVETPFPSGPTPAALALTSGYPEMVAALGVPAPTLTPPDALTAAALTADRATWDALRAEHPDEIESLRAQRPGLTVWAASHGRPGAVGILLDAGWPVDAMGRTDVPRDDPWQTALHAAAQAGDVALARDLLARGADPTIRDAQFGGTPGDWARFFQHPEVAALLTPTDPDGP
ncbi:ankyrin repeat domain-containing protein [Asanoa sp. WMMD1127]|uniref:ankyrin repeat domain-containing protein n=1 Tax=Asanoa sp. WMMD1127 TaxID=3016107 RepID=UPI002416403E|nr:ankyrin repeat domain-containing protein [Asanoa sp. WMMD1127]MDG4826564.1 ankyrin repeat domain-containing protein [Asanoa sp. WMMD1127]